MEDTAPLRSLTIYLLKDCAKATDALQRGKGGSRHEIEGIGTLVVRRPRYRPPKWATFFDGRIDASILGKGGRPDAALLTTVDERHFAITFGSGRFLLDPLRCEQRFGLLVALNTIDENRVRSIDKHTFGRIASQSRVQASRDAPPTEFGLDIEQDLLRAVAGVPKDAEEGETIAGLDALHVTTRVTIDSLRARLSEYLKSSTETRYRRAFPWVDQIADIRDPKINAELNNVLVELLQEGETDKIWMAPENIINWHEVSMFQFGDAHSAARHTQLTLTAFLEYLGDLDDLTAEGLERKRVTALNADDDATESWPAMRCLYAEIDHRGKAYVLNAGKWYSLDRDFIGEVNNAVKRIETVDLGLPEYEDESEGDYNQRVHGLHKAQYALMDQQNIWHGGGRSQIEFCDLYSTDRKLIHLKRYGGSSVLSHLFNQGVVSGELFCSDAGFREKVNALLPPTHRLANPDAKPSVSDYKVILGVIGGPALSIELPFFSRVALKNAVKRLEMLGYPVAFTHIGVEERHAIKRSFREKTKAAAGRRPAAP